MMRRKTNPKDVGRRAGEQFEGGPLQAKPVPGSCPDAAFADVVMVEMDRLMVLGAEQELPPLIRQSDLLLVDMTVEKKLPRRDGIYVPSVARGLAIRQVSGRLKGTFLV